MNRTLSALVAALALPLAACDSWYVEAEQPLACLTLQPQTFLIPTIAPVPGGGFEGSWTETTTVNVGDVLPGFILDGPPQDRRIQLVSFGISLTGGATNLDWLKSLQVSATNMITPVQLVAYQGGVPAGARSINLPASNPGANLADYLASGNLTLVVSGSASVPAGSTIPSTWTGSVNVCVQAHVKKTFNQMINP